MFAFWNTLFFILKYGLMAAGAYFGTSIFYVDVSVWLANYITVAQTLSIVTYATTIVSGIIVGYIAYKIIGGLIANMFQGSILSAAQGQMRSQMNNMRDNFFR